MHTVSKEIKDRQGKVFATIEVSVADTIDDAVTLSGSPDAAVALFNRSYAQDRMNAARPGRSSGLGEYGLFFSKLDQAVQDKCRAKAEALDIPLKELLGRLFASMVDA